MINSNKPLVVFQSAFATRSGYGMFSLDVAKSLLRYCKAKDYDLRMIPTAWGACSKRNMEDLLSDPEARELVDRVLKENLTRQPDLYFHVSIPNEFTPHGKFNIGITAGIETTTASPQFIEGLNRMNMNIVMSNFNKQVFNSTEYLKKNPNGTSEPLKSIKPIEVLHWGIDTSIYKKTEEKNANIEDAMVKIPETFAFLFSGQWTHGNINGDRKSIGHLIDTFLRAFADVKNPPCLILKSSGAQISAVDRHECILKINEVTNMVKSSIPNAKLPNVYLFYGELTDIEMNALFNHEKVKVHVSFTHGESWGMSGLMGTMTGKPSILPKWSGHLDYLNPEYADFFEGKLEPIPNEAVNDWLIKDSQWFNVDREKASEKMKSYFTNYSQERLDKAEKLRIENIAKFSSEAMDAQFHALLDKYVPPIARENAIVLPRLKRIELPKLVKK